MSSGERMKNYTKEDHDKFVRTFKNIYTGMCNGRSIWTIDCRKFDDSDNDRSMRKHIGRNPKITKSIWESENYHALHGRRHVSVLLQQNIVIMISKSGQHRSFANSELSSNTLTRCRRRQHSVSLLHLSELDLGEIRALETVRNVANSHSEFFKHTMNRSKPSVYDVFLCPTR